MRKYQLAATAVVLALLSLGAASVDPPTAVTRTGSQSKAVEGTLKNATWNLTGAVWDKNSPDPIKYPIRSDAATNSLVKGGRVNGMIPRSWTRDQWYDAEDGGKRLGGEAVRLTLTNTTGNTVTVRNTRVSDVEDAYDPQQPAAAHTGTVVLDHVRSEYVRDDAIEDEGYGLDRGDRPVNMTVKSSMLEAFTLFAFRPPGSVTARNGNGDQALRVSQSLLWSRPMPLGLNYTNDFRESQGRVLPTSDPKVWLGSHGIWKWSNQAPRKVVITDSIFRLDVPSYTSQHSSEWPDGTYRNVTIVWTGKGNYFTAGGYHNTLPPGVRVTTDLSVWTRARNAWLAGDRTPVPVP